MSPNQNPWSIIIKSACVLSLIIYLSACSSGESDEGKSNDNDPPPVASPKDTYFSLAITENSHNHVGARLLFLDFQDTADDTKIKNNVIIAPKLTSPITLDGKIIDWDDTLFTIVNGLPQNNYPLSEFYDAVPVNIKVGAAWDDNNVYFVVQWQDANNDGSTKYKKWVYGDQGNGEEGWNPKVHKPVAMGVGAPNETKNVVNINHTLSGAEDEDRVLIMFPIDDSEGNFIAEDPNDSSRRGLGCAAYCHPNLKLDDPAQPYTGTGVSKMHTNAPGDIADIWHWKSTRTRPSGFADDKYLEHDTGTGIGGNDGNGRQPDTGIAAYVTNELNAGGNPTYFLLREDGGIDKSDILPSNLKELYPTDVVVPLNGDEEVPYIISQAPDGSRADVKAMAKFDNGTWTVEFSRRLTTSDTVHDHQFTAGTDATAPPYEAIMAGVPGAAPYGTNIGSPQGDDIFYEVCDTCHSTNGIGDTFGVPVGSWYTPRNQRASGSLIMKTLVTSEDDPAHRMYDVFPLLRNYRDSYLSINVEQMVENLAAFLQEQHTPAP